MNWDDLRFVLALSRAGTVTEAGRTLGVTHTTVSRRIRALEAERGLRLFDRGPAGWTATALGERVVALAESAEEQVYAVDRLLAGRETQLSGRVRFTTVDGFVPWLSPHIGAFTSAYPQVTVDIIATSTTVSLARREADVALRATNTPPETLVGRRVGHLAYAVYAADSLLERIDRSAPLEAFPWLAWDPRLEAHITETWIREHAPRGRIVARVDAFTAMLGAVRGGLGVGHLPCVDGDRTPNLTRLTTPIPGFGMDLWMLVHPDLQRTARVRAFLDLMGERLQGQRAKLLGGADARTIRRRRPG